MRIRSRSQSLGAESGFSLVEVLVTVAIVGTALTVLLGIMRLQIRSTRVLRSHSEARLLLEGAINRFQYGDGAHADSLIQGEFGVYRLSFAPAPGTGASALPTASSGERLVSGGVASPGAELLDDPQLLRRRVSIGWTDGGRGRDISLDAWSFLPAERG